MTTDSFMWLAIVLLSGLLGAAGGAWILGLQRYPTLPSVVLISSVTGAVSGFTVLSVAIVVTFGAPLMTRGGPDQLKACLILGSICGVLGGLWRLRRLERAKREKT